MSYGTVQAEKMTTESGYSLGAGNASSFKNRIINGEMDIDQRNGGASVSLTSGGGNGYPADRWYVENFTDGTATVQQVADAPVGFSNSIRYTVTATDASLASDQSAFIQQRVEGFNSADLSFGTASAKSITVSFWVKSSVTGTFGGALANNAYNRGYPFTYTISSANTWEQKIVTIPGDTTGTWVGATNGVGLRLTFALAAGSARVSTAGAWASYTGIGATGGTNLMATNGATWQLTGVQLEVGTVATSWDFRSIGTELALCQRYFETSYALGTAVGTATDTNSCMWLSNRNPGAPHNQVRYVVTKRATASVAIYSTAAANTSGIYNVDSGATYTPTFSRDGSTGGTLYTSTSVALGQFLQFHYTASAEL